MNKLIVGVILLGLTNGVWAAVDSDAFFPLNKGDTWVYDTLKKAEKSKPGSVEGSKVKISGEHFDMKVTVSDSWKEKDHSGMILTQRDKRGQMREFLSRNEKGVFIHKLGLKKSVSPEVNTNFTPPVPRVIFPLEPGTKVHWEGNLKVAWVDKRIIFDGEVVGWEDIEVPAGKFKCIKLYYHQKRGDEVVDEWAWYAEGVGQVKYDGGQYVRN